MNDKRQETIVAAREWGIKTLRANTAGIKLAPKPPMPVKKGTASNSHREEDYEPMRRGVHLDPELWKPREQD